MPKIKSASIFFIFLSVWLFWNCQKPEQQALYDTPKSLVADSAVVVSPHPLATQIGLEIMRQGGNATDATIAVQFAIAVVYPRAGNLGGGGFLIARKNNGQAYALDYREKAPLLANRDMYLDSLGNVVEGLSTRGHLAAGVPGTVAGMFAAHDSLGKLPMATLIQPAIDLARDGFKVTEAEANRLNRFQEDFREFNTAPNPFIKDEWKAGDLLIQTELAATLERIKQQGSQGFYQGETARLIQEEMQSAGGLIDLDDLKNYQAKWRQPIRTEYEGLQLISMPPPSSGGIALAQLLELVEDSPLSEDGFQDAKSVHRMVEAMRRVYADRAEYLGDSDFYPVPVDSLLDQTYLVNRMADFSPTTASVSDSVKAGAVQNQLESFETTHTSIIDPAGNAVSVTTTLNSNYGCKVIVDGAGFFLNNEMDDFSAKPGVPNQFGLVGAEANAIEPHKRMLSSMTPTIVEKDGQAWMVLGAPGGSTIITAVYQVILNVHEFGMPIDEAVAAPRFHHQWLPDVIMVEPTAIAPDQRAILQEMGHQLDERQRMAVVKAILRQNNGKLHGAGDPRNPDDTVAGF